MAGKDSRYPQHVVKEWAGHASVETTAQFDLKVEEGDYERAAGINKQVVVQQLQPTGVARTGEAA